MDTQRSSIRMYILYVLFVYLFTILGMKYEALQKAKSTNNLREYGTARIENHSIETTNYNIL